MNKPSILMVTIFFLYFGNLLIQHLHKNNQPPSLKTQANPNDSKFLEMNGIQELRIIVLALEKYKTENYQYPISKDNGKDWDTKISLDGKVKDIWIKDLIPKYLTKLPNDVRYNYDYYHQYRYISDGAHYELIATNPHDCNKVKSLNTALIYKYTSECSYGFWTIRKQK